MPRSTPLLRLLRSRLSQPITPSSLRLSKRTLTSNPRLSQQQAPLPPEPSGYNFYRTHGRAFLKAFTLAFLTMQIVQTAWLVFEAEEIQDAKNAEIEELKGEVRLLDEGRGSHRPKLEKKEGDQEG